MICIDADMVTRKYILSVAAPKLHKALKGCLEAIKIDDDKPHPACLEALRLLGTLKELGVE